ncbi:MAG TPA: hypothetical protein VMV36_00060 [Ignavibacteriaceae bacterium]|nr:hypothetical protein [Ignavibacteriaceae bacterium]
MFSLLLIYGIVSFISIAVLFYFMKSAPSGWEDEEGFHIDTHKL